MSTQFDPAQDGNLFPREDLLEAVAESDWRDRPAPWYAWALLALGLVALCLGLPLERVVHVAETETAAGLQGFRALSAPLLIAVKRIGQGTGIGIEATLFFTSALGAGLAFLLTGAALRAFGFRGRVAIVCALAAALCPLCVVASRLPSAATATAAGSALLLAACAAPFDPGARGARGLALRVGLAYLFATSLAIEAVVLAIPAWFALIRRIEPEHRGLALPAASPLFVAAAAMAAAPPLPPGLELPDIAFWGRAPETPFPDLAANGLAPWLAAGALVLAWPLALARESEEQGAPAWLHVWAALGLGLGFLTSRATALALPALAVFLADALVRRARPDGAGRRALLFAAGQIALCAIVLLRLERTPSPFASHWIPSPTTVLPTDTVVLDDTGTPDAYLLRRRIGARTVTPGALPRVIDGRTLWASSASPVPEGTLVLSLESGSAGWPIE
ncbi:MAG: hypothetical protein AAFP22_15580 [Planctomycetota bacterium]